MPSSQHVSDPRHAPTCHHVRVWAPRPDTVDLVLADQTRMPMQPGPDGWWESPTALPVGTRYAFSLDHGDPRPDPRSRFQPEGVHGFSELVELTPVAPWPGMDLRGRVLHELHIGTFTPGGTFDSAVAAFDDLVALGVDAVEVMPVAQFPGHRGWGYDGVDLFATQASYGGPLAFRRFVDAAHQRGLGVILDVVYNHLGPEGNYLAEFGPWFNPDHQTPWGPAVNLDGDGSRQVRDHLLANARYWLVDIGVDGLRLDAVHALADDSHPHFLAELSRNVEAWQDEAGRPLTLIAESDLNQPDTVSPIGSTPGARGMDMQWDDDVHHGLHAFFTGETDGYYCDFGSAETLAKALARVFVHDGGYSTFRGRDWGAPVDPSTDRYDGHSFVVFIQDHDQVGNRAAGDRLGARGQDPGAQAAAAALYLLSPYTPMLFMGEEWAASTPFPYFSDLSGELGRQVTEGRRREFSKMSWEDDVPDPQSAATFGSAVLDRGERQHGHHRRMLEWYQNLLGLRRDHPQLRDPALPGRVDVLDDDTVALHRGPFTVTATRRPTASRPWVEVSGPQVSLRWA